MTLATDIAGDYAAFDFVETVSLTPRNPAGTPVTGISAHRGPLARNDLRFTDILGLQPTDIAFSLFAATMGGSVPKSDDTITDASGDVWTIISVNLLTLGTRWRCICRQQE